MANIIGRSRARVTAIFSFIVLIGTFPACEMENLATLILPTQENYDLAAELKLLDETFRIDIETPGSMPSSAPSGGAGERLAMSRPGHWTLYGRFPPIPSFSH